MNIHFQLVTPQRTLLEQELASLSCPTPLGQITILPGHAPLVTMLVPGELHARTETDDFYIFVSGGFAEIRAGGEVIVLADSAEHHYEIDMAQAETAKARAEQDMKEIHAAHEEYARVSASLEKSLARLDVARKHAHRRQPITGQSMLDQ